MLVVHVSDVNPQAVTLVERSIAQTTGKLAVPGVHTPGVLEVLVPIVLVAEQLTTPVTRVAGSACG